MRVRYVALFFFSSILAWGAVPFVSHAAANVVITQSTTFAAGEYYFDSLTITSSSTLTLLGNPTATTSFKGVVIHAGTLTIDSGSRISADSKGYGANKGPGASLLNYAGASYGGIGAYNTATSTYGSALEPIDLGSGGNTSGGGAIQLLVSGTLINNGTVSANGGASSSGGSILVNAGTLAGQGSFKALGGGLWSSGYYKQPGGGGRIMIRYAASSFAGTVDVSGGCGGPDYMRTCAGSGTTGFIDTTTNTLLLPQAWRFQMNDSPFSFANIVVAKGGAVSEPGVSISADQLALSVQGSASFGDGVRLAVPLVSLDEASTLSFSGAADAVIGDLTISGGSRMTTTSGQVLNLSLANLIVSSGSSVDVSAKGYAAMKGPGAPSGSSSGMGASYGGRGYANTATSTYGSADEPIDLGSGATGAGGGALALTLSGTLTNNGSIMANGQWSGSGGSILVRAHEIIGSGSFSANGAGKTNSSYLGPGGGGRIALYTNTATSSFTGKVEAKGACNTMFGYYTYCGGDGTVVIKNTGPKVSSVLFLPGIEASRLYYRGMLGIEHQVWEPSYHTDIPYLAMNADGTSKYPLYTRDIISALQEHNPLWNTIASVFGTNLETYRGFEDFMDSLVASSTLGFKEWRAYPYDWRYDVRDIVEEGTPTEMSDGSIQQVHLDEVLREMASSSSSHKVTIVAHSNGGLLAKALAEKLGADASKYIDRIIMVGTPQWGTPMAAGALLHADNFSDVPSLIIRSGEVRSVTSGMSGPYGLLPSPAYFSQVSDPVATFATGGFLSGEYAESFGEALSSFSALTGFLTDAAGLDAMMGSASDLRVPIALPSALVNKGAATHEVLDAWTPPADIAVTAIAGWGQDTVKTLAYSTGSKVVCTNTVFSSYKTCADSPTLLHTPVTTQDGDGTVVSPSAVGNIGSGLYFNAKGFNKENTRSVAHKDLTSAEPVQNVILDLLKGQLVTEGKFVTSISPVGAENPMIRVSSHSPVNLVVTDASGNQSGVVPIPGTDFSGIKRDIPDSSVQVFDDEEYISVPTSGAYQVTASGYAAGSATLVIETVSSSGDASATAVFADIPVTGSSVASFSVSEGSASAPTVDVDGDGMTDFTAASSSAGADPLTYMSYLKSIVGAMQLTNGKKNELVKRLDEIERQLAKQKSPARLQLDILERYVEQQVALSARLPAQGIPATQAEIILGMITRLQALL
jgi:pimeloyl-ACP methyl ester carboxylesterase